MVRLVCWNAERESELRRKLESAGFDVDPEPVAPGKLITQIRLTQPQAVVIDLERLPSHGREVGVALRTTKSTRAIPLVFLGGDPSKVASELPDAIFGQWTQASGLIRKAIRNQLAAPVVPVPHMQRFGAATLEKKLGLSGRVAVIGAPDGFAERLSTPVESHWTSETKLAIWFIRSRDELEREIEFMALHPPLWIAFPKQSGRFKPDFTQHDVRTSASRAGLVDNKVCVIDNDWSAIRFARRK